MWRTSFSPRDLFPPYSVITLGNRTTATTAAAIFNYFYGRTYYGSYYTDTSLGSGSCYGNGWRSRDHRLRTTNFVKKKAKECCEGKGVSELF